MDWSKGYSATFYACIVDKSSWRDIERFGITGGSINRTLEGLRCSADINTKGYIYEEEKYIRIYLDTEQSGATSHVPLFTGLATTPSRDIDGYYEANKLQCYSVLKAAKDVLLDRGYYVPAGASIGDIIKNLLSVVPAPVEIADGAPKLLYSIVAEEGETPLSMVDKVLGAIPDWRMVVLGDGTLRVEEKPKEAEYKFDPVEADFIEPTLKVTYDWYEAPNCFRAIGDDLCAVARDDDPESKLSTVSRGREIWAQETSVKLSTEQSIAEYAVNRLKELQQLSLTASYKRRFAPSVGVGDCVLLHYPVQGLDGTFCITSQKIELGHNATTSEEVEKI